LIHNPVNHDQVRLGEGLQVHATARSTRGVKRLEFWADGTLVDVQLPPSGKSITPLVISSQWQPDTPGSHSLVVRAYSADNIEGQAAVAIEAVGSEESGLTGHTVVAGETFEEIAGRYGMSAEDLQSLNPEADPAGIAPGDDLTVPGGSGGPEDAPPSEEPPAGADAPDPLDDPPDSDSGILEFLGLNLHAFFFRDPVPSEVLTIEALNLETGLVYESVHCYLSLGGSEPHWYPDNDNDQATDESFTNTGDNHWNIAGYLGGSNAPVINWPGDRNLTASIACIGIAGGGTDAIELGQVDLDIPPEEWDHITRRVDSLGGEGSFKVEYRVTQGATSHGFPIYLDERMTPPTNLTMAISTRDPGLHNVLLWDYNSLPDAEAINGFRIYLNGTLQWVEPADARSTDLPHEWFSPPCGDRYTFTVTAFRYGFPDGPESLPATPPVTSETHGPESCQRQVNVTFLTLNTHTLPGDGDRDPGDNGPVYGYFYANIAGAWFDGRDDTWGGLGFNNNSEYSITGENGLTTDRDHWRNSGPAQFLVEVGDGDTLSIGYHIDDEDTGWGNRDDLVCEGRLDYSYTDLDRSSGVVTIPSENEACDVTFTLGITGGPLGNPGETLLPWLQYLDMSLDEATGEVRMLIQNTGTASWPFRPLEVALSRRNGEMIQMYTWDEFALAPGEETTLGGFMVPAPLDYCVIIDPNNTVPELYEVTGALYHGPVCPVLPDLVPTNVEYDPSGGGRLRVTIQNQGEGEVVSRTIYLHTLLADGSRSYTDLIGTNVSLGPSETTVKEIISIPESVREQMKGGYSVIVNPDHTITETNYENNSYQVGPARQIWVELFDVCGTALAEYAPHNYTVWFRADVISGTQSRRVIDWTVEDIEFYAREMDDEDCSGVEELRRTELIDVAGDERLVFNFDAEVTITGTHYDLEGASLEIDLADESQSFPLPSINPQCFRTVETGNFRQRIYVDPIGLNPTPGYYFLFFTICREPE